MNIVIYSDILNQHQIQIADELFRKTNGSFRFVELKSTNEYKGGSSDFSDREYLIKSWESPEMYSIAMEYAKSADCCIFSGITALPFEKKRMQLGLLSFDMSERWFKKGYINLISPRLLKWLLYYHLFSWKYKPIYKLCCSAYCYVDNLKLGAFKNRSYKWGYFPIVNKRSTPDNITKNRGNLMWCGRFIKLKHPELPVYLAKRLIDNGYEFHLDMYGTGELEQSIISLAEKLLPRGCYTFHGAVTNEIVHQAMRMATIFLLTSDENEGWGAVANESMYERCALVAGDGAGSVPYLINHMVDGLVFKGPSRRSSISKPDLNSIDEMYKHVSFLLDNKDACSVIQNNAYKKISGLWSAENAANSLMLIINELSGEREGGGVLEGPCSKA